ncbi:MAG TPA: DUF126 domain-containing protein [Casimicrobiaceae bacterium]|nr:DUF126 domain-containing protein [Casimicrobiaceae bacterium]
MSRTLQGVAIVEGEAEGAALVCNEALAFSLVDPATGRVKQPNHPWTGQSIARRVLFFPSGTGSSSGSYWLFNLAHEGKAPAAIVNTQTDAVITAGAVLAGIPLVHRVTPDPLACVKTGDRVRVHPSGMLEILGRSSAEAP